MRQIRNLSEDFQTGIVMMENIPVTNITHRKYQKKKGAIWEGTNGNPSAVKHSSGKFKKVLNVIKGKFKKTGRRRLNLKAD